MEPDLLAMLTETERADYHEACTHPACRWTPEAVQALYRSLAETRRERDRTRQRWNTEAEHIQALYLETLQERDTAIADLRRAEAQVERLRTFLKGCADRLEGLGATFGLDSIDAALAASEEEK